MFPEYGSGELPQAFCRAAAVRGAIYVLRRKLQAVLLDRETQQCQGVKTASGQVLCPKKTSLQNLPSVPNPRISAIWFKPYPFCSTLKLLLP